MKILIKNGHVIDPDTKLDQVADVLLEDNKIQEVKENIKDKADVLLIYRMRRLTKLRNLCRLI